MPTYYLETKSEPINVDAASPEDAERRATEAGYEVETIAAYPYYVTASKVALLDNVSEPRFCRGRPECRGKGYCPREFACNG